MLPVVIFGGIGLLTAAAWKKSRDQNPQSAEFGVMSPDDKYGLIRALDAKLPKAKYLEIADAYEAKGLKGPAELLRKRAKLGDMSPEDKAKWNSLITAALRSEKVDGIREVATYAAQIGAVGVASRLFRHAKAIETNKKIPVTPPTPAEAVIEEVMTVEAPADDSPGDEVEQAGVPESNMEQEHPGVAVNEEIQEG